MGPIENKVLKVAGNFKTHEYCKSNANENVIISTFGPKHELTPSLSLFRKKRFEIICHIYKKRKHM